MNSRGSCLYLVAALTATLLPVLSAAGQAESTFKQRCAVCHTVGGGRLVGPDLAGIQERRSAAWLRTFVRSSQSMIKSGDADAVAVFEEYGLVMPDHPDLSDAQIDEIIAYVAQAGSVAVADAEQTAAPVVYDEGAVRSGADLFQGLQRFANGGPACNSCHHVVNDAVIGGGVLAKELTDVFTRMGAPGVQAILGSPPFPVMQQAYASSALNAGEIEALVAFLQDTDAKHLLQTPRDYGWGLFSAGLAIVVVLFAVYALLWRNRKRRSVYGAIYDRQLRTI